ncbi:MAG TPA: GGDEF domain-containing protein [Thermoanaerobaculia bacterium]
MVEEFDETAISSKLPTRPADEPPEQPSACLIIISHPDPGMLGRQYAIAPGEELIIGRANDASITLGLPVISRRHARLRRSDDEVTLEDLGSRNGTFLQGAKLHEAACLRHGDQFSVESVHFRFITGSNIEQAFHEAIYDLVTHDDLTGIYNRRKYEKEVERDFARAVRYNRQLSIVLFDIDEFKEINDRFGHLGGDSVLRQMADLVGTQLRREGIFARFGGDEFVVLCPEVGLSGARVLAERLRSCIAEHRFNFEGHTVRVTCSFGVAERTAETRFTSDLYAAADASLYAAKYGGRNRTS